MARFEVRIGWSINMVGGNDDGEWAPHDGPEQSIAEVKESFHKAPASGLSRGLEEALEAAGFEWWLDVREIAPTTRQEQGANDER